MALAEASSLFGASMSSHGKTGSGWGQVRLALLPSRKGPGPGPRVLPLIDHRFALKAVPKGPHSQEWTGRASGEPGPVPAGVMSVPSTCPALSSAPCASFCLTEEEIEAQRVLAAVEGHTPRLRAGLRSEARDQLSIKLRVHTPWGHTLPGWLLPACPPHQLHAGAWNTKIWVHPCPAHTCQAPQHL